jgi:hypothetical protein
MDTISKDPDLSSAQKIRALEEGLRCIGMWIKTQKVWMAPLLSPDLFLPCFMVIVRYLSFTSISALPLRTCLDWPFRFASQPGLTSRSYTAQHTMAWLKALEEDEGYLLRSDRIRVRDCPVWDLENSQHTQLMQRSSSPS